MTARADEIGFQAVKREQDLSLRSFDAVYSAAEFMRRGFAEPAGQGQLQFYGPDAEVLLDDVLIENYCLELSEPQRERPTQVGLRFRPMKRLRGRVDIDGTLWIDTLARALSDIEYSYLGLESWANDLKPGGAVAFKETSPATVWISDWNIRMTGAGVDYGQRPPPRDMRNKHVVVGGAELAAAFWQDGREWRGRFGAVSLTPVTREGAPLIGAKVRLDSTDYTEVTDSIGRAVILELLPGPYRISVIDSTLAVVDTALPATAGFNAIRDSMVSVRAVVPTLNEFVSRECMEREAFADRSPMFVARIVVGVREQPLERTKWRLEAPAGVNDPNAPPDGIYAAGQTGSNGMVFFCAKLSPGQRVVLRAWSPWDRSGGSGTELTVTLRERITAVKLAIPR
jgi:hypothetical protein